MAVEIGPQSLAVTVPANTPAENPVKADFTLAKAILTKVEVHFPPGCVGMVKCALYYGIKQLIPVVEGQYLAGDSETVSLRVQIPLPDHPTTLTFKAWSPGTSYPHTLQVRLESLPEEEALPGRGLARLIALFRRLFGV